MKISLFLILIILGVSELSFAAPAKVMIKGTTEKSAVMNKLMGIDRFVLQSEAGKSGNFVIPEEQCRQWLLLVVGKKITWVYLLPGEILEIDTANEKWQFGGDGTEINRYLYAWLWDFYKAKPNLVEQSTESFLFPGQKIEKTTVEMMSSPEYLDWLTGLNKQAQQALKKANIKDREFVKKQSQRIYCAWVEMSVGTYAALQRAGIVPKATRDFFKEVVFDKPYMLEYDLFSTRLLSYFKLGELVNGVSCFSADYLKHRADRIALPELRERYVLLELGLLVFNKLTYQIDRVFASVEKEIVSDYGKVEYAGLREKCLALQAKDQRGTQIRPAEWETPDGEIIQLSQYRGKYLFIDFWGTHCGACKVEMPDRKKLEEYFKDAPVQFLSVCFGATKEKDQWKEMSLKLPLPRDYVFSDRAKNKDDKDWGINYEIPTIPRYMLFDPQEKLVMWDGRRPSDPLLKKQLEEILQYTRKTNQNPSL